MDTTAPALTRSICCQESISRPGHSGPWFCDNCGGEAFGTDARRARSIADNAPMANAAPAALSAEEVAARVSVRRTKDRDGHHWQIDAQGPLSDAEAAGITFRSEPGVILGETVLVEDAGGTRVGYLKSATYHRRAFGPAYVIVTIELH